MKKGVRIDIPKPCSENWGTMTPTENGRHCNACNKTIIDFSAYTNKEILNKLKNGPTCGRFHPSQLNRDFEVSTSKKARFGLAWALALFIPSIGLSQNTKVANTMVQNSIAEKENSAQGELKINGIVLCLSSGEELNSVHIDVVG